MILGKKEDSIKTSLVYTIILQKTEAKIETNFETNTNILPPKMAKNQKLND